MQHNPSSSGGGTWSHAGSRRAGSQPSRAAAMTTAWAHGGVSPAIQANLQHGELSVERILGAAAAGLR